MTCPRFDFHIHTKYLGCANQTMEVPAIVKECARLGVTSLGITDHLNSLDKLDLHVPILRDIRALAPSVQVYFGVELNYLGCDGTFAYDREVKERFGFQFAIGGIHGTYMSEYDLPKLVEIQHRHHLMTCRDPLVDVLVHPYWFSKGEFERNGWPFLDTMSCVPEKLTRELGQVARETGTAIEINATANLVNPTHSAEYVQQYEEYLSVLDEEGVCFSVGSDAHDIGRLNAIKTVWELVERLGVPRERLWHPSCDPIVGKA